MNKTKKQILMEKLEQRHKLDNEIVELEFEVKGYKQGLDNQGIKYFLIRRTPLGKNPSVIGIPKEQYEKYTLNKHLIIIGIQNKRKCDEHIFYVYNPEKNIDYLSGEHSGIQYIHYYLTQNIDGKKIIHYLPYYDD